MALVLKDRVLETCTSPGTGTVTLLGAVTGYQSFSTVGNGNTCYYAIADQNGANFEVGIGTYSTAGTLARTTVLSSSNSGNLVNFSTGSQNIFLTYPSSRSVNLSSAALTTGRVSFATTDGLLTDSANLTFNGTILTSTGLSGPLNGTVGATTASSGAFTTINASTSITNAGLTSGRVTFAGASGLLSDSANLTFDGTNLLLNAATPNLQGTSSTGSVSLVNNSGGAFIRLFGGSHATRANFTDFINGASTSTFASSGNLGINNSNPDCLLSVTGTDGAVGGAIRYTASGVCSAYMSADPNGLCLATDTAGITFRTAVTGNDPTDTGSEVVRITSAGEVGIGTSSPNVYASGARTLVLASSGDNGMTIRSGTTSTGALYFANTENSTSNNGTIEVDHNVLAMSFNIYGAGRSFRFKSAGTEVVRIDSSGNVGIGQINPTVKLDILDTNATYSLSQKIFNASAGTFRIGQAPAATFLSVDNFALAFCTSSDGGVAGTSVPTNERMRILANGNVGIGTSSPNALLEVYGGDIRLRSTSNGANGFLTFVNTSNVVASSIYNYNGLLSLNEQLIINNSTGNVGIGTTSPSARLSVFTSTMTSQIVLGVNPSNTVYGGISFNGNLADGAHLGLGGGGSGDPNLYIDVPTSGQFLFRQGSLSTNAMTLNASGNLLLGTTTQRNAAKFTFEYNGSTNNGLAIMETAVASGTEFITFMNPAGTNIANISRVGVSDAVSYNTTASNTTGAQLNASGVRFPATQVASANVNTLDDYEEGTWSPSIGGSTTYTAQDGYYTKCGNVVTVTGRMQINLLSGNANTYQIDNLPFTSKNTSNGSKAGGGSVGYWSSTAINVISLQTYVETNTINLVFQYLASASSAALTATIFGNSTDIYFTATYLT